MKVFGTDVSRMFGFDLDQNTRSKYEIISLTPQEISDGSQLVDSAGQPIVDHSLAQYGSRSSIFYNENDMITHFREMSFHPLIDKAATQIVDAMFIFDSELHRPIELDLEKSKQTAKIKKRIYEEFEQLYSIINFKTTGHELAKRWYVDGKLYNQMLVDSKDTTSGILGLRNIDPRTIAKFNQVKIDHSKISNINVYDESEANKFFVYNPYGFINGTTNVAGGILIHEDTISYTHSGIADENNKLIFSNLYFAIKALNQLRMIEDSIVIYRVSRASEKRAIYVDVGRLGDKKAREVIAELQRKFKNNLNYDTRTGTMNDIRRVMSMQEDFWMARREGSNSTEITTLPGGENLGNIDDLVVFESKLYQALKVPLTRMNGSEGNALSRGAEITRDEQTFERFINRLRNQFCSGFWDKLLKTQLVLKKVITVEEWDDLKTDISWTYAQDTTFAEMTEIETESARLDLVDKADRYRGKYYSQEHIRKKFLKQSDEQIAEEDEKIANENKKDQELTLNLSSTDLDSLAL